MSHYHFVTIIELQYNYLASKGRNGSRRSAITILLQLLSYNIIIWQATSVFSQNSFWHLHNVVQLWQVSKLQTKPAMSRFRQVAASKLFCASQTQPESLSNFLFADVVVVVIDDDNDYSSSVSC